MTSPYFASSAFGLLNLHCRNGSAQCSFFVSTSNRAVCCRTAPTERTFQDEDVRRRRHVAVAPENLARIPVDLSQIEPRSKASSIVRPNGPKIDRIPWSSVPRAAFLFSAAPALFPYADPMWIAFLRLVTFLQRMVGAFNYSGAVVICLPYMRRRRRSSVRYHSFIWLAWTRLNC